MIKTEIENQQDSMIRLGYKARPLNGIWATAPYLHNASVRTLYQLLLPAEQREKTFNLGSKEFDPVNVGYVDGPAAKERVKALWALNWHKDYEPNYSVKLPSK